MTEINEQEHSSELVDIIDETEEAQEDNELPCDPLPNESEAFDMENVEVEEDSQPTQELSEPSEIEDDPFEKEGAELSESDEVNDMLETTTDGEIEVEEEITPPTKAPKQNLKESLKQQLSPEEVAPMAREWLIELFEKMAVPNVQIEVETDPKARKFVFYLHADLSLNPQLSAIMSTPKMTSHTINSIQTILHTYIDRLVGGNFTVEFDINDYFKSRTSKFEVIAQDLADLSISLKRSLTIAGLSSFDRRVIHNTLSNTKEVSTASVGQGSFRKLCIEPKRTK